MKTFLVAIAAVAILVLASGPITSIAAANTPSCTYTATPSRVPVGVNTPVTLHYTISPGSWWIEWSLYNFAGGGALAYGTSGDQHVVVNGAKNYEMFVIDLGTGNAHYCKAQITGYSNSRPN